MAVLPIFSYLFPKLPTMHIDPFKLERYFARYEFSAPYLLSSSDCEPLDLNELLSMIHGETMKMWNVLSLGYTESQGNPELRSEIAGLHQSIQPEQTMVCAPEEGIFIAMNTLLKEKDEVISTFPAYQSLYEVARSMGCRIKYWQPRYDQGWHFEVEDLEELMTPKTRLLIINFPHNPTGATITPKQQERITELAHAHDTILFSDEMYRYLEYDEATRLPSMADKSEQAVTLSGMSKSFALAGLRIGWLTTKNNGWLKRFMEFKDYTTICNSAPSEILALMGLRAKDKILRRNHDIIRTNLAQLDDFFSRHESFFEWKQPEAGPVAFPKLNETIDPNDFCHDLVEKKGVMLLPPSVYDFQGNHFRIGFARKNLPEALEKLEEYLEEHPAYFRE